MDKHFFIFSLFLIYLSPTHESSLTNFYESTFLKNTSTCLSTLNSVFWKGESIDNLRFYF